MGVVYLLCFALLLFSVTGSCECCGNGYVPALDSTMDWKKTNCVFTDPVQRVLGQCLLM